MISKQFNAAKEVRDCLRRNSDRSEIQAERGVRRLVYKAYRLGRKEGRLAIVARKPVELGGTRSMEGPRPALEEQAKGVQR